jgi:hypothetical protein
MMLKLAIPVLHVSSSNAAQDFYCDRLGFSREFAYRRKEASDDPCYMGVRRRSFTKFRAPLRIIGSTLCSDAVCQGTPRLMRGREQRSLHASYRGTHPSTQLC